MKIKEVERKRDLLEEKIETLMNEFSANTGVYFGPVEIWADGSGKIVVSIELVGDEYL